jgi:hypothetical protein
VLSDFRDLEAIWRTHKGSIVLTILLNLLTRLFELEQ